MHLPEVEPAEPEVEPVETGFGQRDLRKPYRLVLTGLVLLLLGLGFAWASGEGLPRDLISAGGGMVSQSGLVLQTAVGQPVAGAVDNGFVLCSGFWCGSGALAAGPAADFQLYLPAIVR